MPPKCFESEVESFLEGSHGDRTHIKRADHPRLHHYAGHYLPIARKYSPSVGKMVQNGRFVACRASFFADAGGRGVCWANFVAPSGTVVRPRSPPPALRQAVPCAAALHVDETGHVRG